MPTKHYLRTGEYVAMAEGAIHHDADGFYFLVGNDAPENDTHGTVGVVHVRGALAHYRGDGGDSYEAILERVGIAFGKDPKPTSVILRIESPGGVVAGLNECVGKLQRMSAAAKIPLIAYVDEMAASAAFAIACACSERLAPASAVVGSIGVISTMVSQSKADAAMGLDFRLITSGKRKADGHPHAPITDDAVKAETARNTELASQFFALAGKALGVSPKKLASLEAAICLGREAERVGLIDDVISFDDAILGLDMSDVAPDPEPAPNNGNVTDRRAKNDALDNRVHPATSSLHTTREASMPVKLDALIKKTEAAIVQAGDDAKKLRPLQARLAAFVATRAEMDDDSDDDEDDKKDDDEDDDESKSKKAAEAAKKAKAKAEASKHKAKAAEHRQKAAEYDEAAKKCEDGDEDSEEAEEAALRIEGARATVPALTPGAAAAIAAQGETLAAALKDIATMKADTASRHLAAMIDEARAARRITPGEAKTLAKKPVAFVKDFLEMRPKALVAVDEERLEQPNGAPGGDIPANVKAIVDQSIEAMSLTGKDADGFREKSYEAHRKAMANGAGVH